MPEVEPKQRLQLLKDNCDSHEETTFYKDLTPLELDIKRETLTENLIKISHQEDILDEAKAIYKMHADPLKKANKELLIEVKTGKSSVKGMLFNFADHENGIMETYDEMGDFVQSRRLKPEEKQARLFVSKSAVNE